VLFNYNLPPGICFHQENVLCIGVIPGPSKPLDFDSFLWPLIQELLELELGVLAFDASTQRQIQLHAHLLVVFGDILAVSMAIQMKGHNGICPCRSCKIRGVRVPGSDNSPHYMPLDRTHHPLVHISGSQVSYNPRQLPRWMHKQFLAHARQVIVTPTAGKHKRLTKENGITGTPILACLSTICFPHSFPYNFMHLLWENVVKNMFLF
jgi:hypothetical protein